MISTYISSLYFANTVLAGLTLTHCSSQSRYSLYSSQAGTSGSHDVHITAISPGCSVHAILIIRGRSRRRRDGCRTERKDRRGRTAASIDINGSVLAGRELELLYQVDCESLQRKAAALPALGVPHDDGCGRSSVHVLRLVQTLVPRVCV